MATDLHDNIGYSSRFEKETNAFHISGQALGITIPIFSVQGILKNVDLRLLYPVDIVCEILENMKDLGHL